MISTNQNCVRKPYGVSGNQRLRIDACSVEDAGRFVAKPNGASLRHPGAAWHRPAMLSCVGS